MIQELFGGQAGATTGLLNRSDRNHLPINSGHHVFDQASPSPSPSPSSSTTTTTTATTTTTTSVADVQKLRCPRCDSSNTKFCYYNNYNLTQPRHFCKTCRRYWTKGGALRNVPIGGGCRKNKGGGTTIATAVGKPISANGKLKAVVSSELIGKTGFINGFEVPEFNSNSNHNPILWSAPPPQSTSHLLSLLRAQNPNPNFGSTHNINIKDQSFMVGSNMGNLGFEPLAAQASLSLWRNNQQQNHHHQLQQQHQQNQHQGGGGIMISGVRSSSDHAANNLFYHHNDHQAAITPNLILGGINVANNTTTSTTNSTTTILDSAPVNVASGDHLGFWNQTLPWSDLAAAANGAYP